MSLEQRIAEKLHQALDDLEQVHASVLTAERGLGTGRSGQSIIRLTVEDVAAIAARAADEEHDA